MGATSRLGGPTNYGEQSPVVVGEPGPELAPEQLPEPEAPADSLPEQSEILEFEPAAEPGPLAVVAGPEVAQVSRELAAGERPSWFETGQ